MTDLILLHGFSQTAASFEPLRAALADHAITTVAPELAGHGTGRPVDADLWHGADALVAAGHRGVWLGYSMGARLALHVALSHPEAVSALVLIGGTAGIDDPDERVARRDRDAALAMRIESIGVEAFLTEWLAMPMFASLPPEPDRLARRATNTAAGLASSLRLWGTGTMDPPLWNRLDEIAAPTLVLAGSLDAKFTALGRRLADSIGTNATFAAIDGAGHAAHLERPVTTAQIISGWLTATNP